MNGTPQPDSAVERQVSSDSGRFAVVPEWLLTTGVNATAVVVYAHLALRADRTDGGCYPTRRTIAADVGCSRDTVDRAVAALIEVGALTVTQRRRPDGSKSSNLYTVHRVRRQDGNLSAPVGQGGRTNAARGGRTNADAELEPEGTRTREPEELLAPDGATGEAVAADDAGQSLALDVVPAPSTPARRSRARDEVWEAMLAVCGVALDDVPSSARGAYNRAAASLREVGATPETIALRAAVYRRRWPDASLTPTALARRWPECNPDRQHGAPPQTVEERQHAEARRRAWGGDTE